MTFKDHRVDWLTAGRDDQYSAVGQFNGRIVTSKIRTVYGQGWSGHPSGRFMKVPQER